MVLLTILTIENDIDIRFYVKREPVFASICCMCRQCRCDWCKGSSEQMLVVYGTIMPCAALTHKAPATMQQTTISNFAAFSKLTNKA